MASDGGIKAKRLSDYRKNKTEASKRKPKRQAAKFEKGAVPF